ncbi:MAG TPA: CopD family protein, partial [Gemmatimonadaceae bacterium]
TMGRVELWRTMLTLLPIWALVLARRPGLAFVLSVPSLLLSAAIGHSAAFHPALSIPLKAIHLIALAAWLGGLLWLVTRQTSGDERLTAETWRVSTVALWGVIAITLSGVIQTALLVPTLPGLRSAYGFMILIKVVGLLVLIAFGAYHRRLIPQMASSGPGSVLPMLGVSVRRELVVFWLVVIAGGVLANVSPPAAVTAPQLTASESQQ